MAIAETKGIPTPAFDALPRRTRIHGTALEILYPPPGFALEDRAMGGRETWRKKVNNRSMVLGIRMGGVGILFPGDIEQAAEADLVEMCGDRLGHRVLVAPHHGSRTSSTPAFLRSVAPGYVLVSAGWRNRFRCPHPEVVARYRAAGARILRTDTGGAIAVETDGRRLVVRPSVAP
jgi:competence protein ComEC